MHTRCLPSPQLANDKALNLSTVRHFVIDECDKVLEKLGERRHATDGGMGPTCAAALRACISPGLGLPPPRGPLQPTCPLPTPVLTRRAPHPLASLPPDMRGDVQEIFKKTPHEKQVMMFSATLSQDVRPVCKRFMANVRGSWAGGRPTGHGLGSCGGGSGGGGGGVELCCGLSSGSVVKGWDCASLNRAQPLATRTVAQIATNPRPTDGPDRPDRMFDRLRTK